MDECMGGCKSRLKIDYSNQKVLYPLFCYFSPAREGSRLFIKNGHKKFSPTLWGGKWCDSVNLSAINCLISLLPFMSLGPPKNLRPFGQNILSPIFFQARVGWAGAGGQKSDFSSCYCHLIIYWSEN